MGSIALSLSRQSRIESQYALLPMTVRFTPKLVLLGAVLFLVAAACGDGDSSPEVSAAATVASTSTTTATTTTTVAFTSTTTATTTTTEASAVPSEPPLPAEVTETYTIPGFGYSIDYPIGWSVETRGSVTIIAQTEEQLQAGFSDADVAPVAVSVSLDHRTVAFLRGIGLTSDDPTAQDLLEFNTSNFGWTDIRDLGEEEVFGTIAAVARVTNPAGYLSISYQGVRPDAGEVLLLSLVAPTEESLDSFLPAWEAMFESIATTE
jgi:hypothetical protein